MKRPCVPAYGTREIHISQLTPSGNHLEFSDDQTVYVGQAALLITESIGIVSVVFYDYLGGKNSVTGGGIVSAVLDNFDGVTAPQIIAVHLRNLEGDLGRALRSEVSYGGDYVRVEPGEPVSWIARSFHWPAGERRTYDLGILCRYFILG